MATETKHFQTEKRKELHRWTNWREDLVKAVKRSELYLDEIDGMAEEDVSVGRDPELASIDGAAGLSDILFPIVEEMMGKGYTPEEAARKLREAADRVESHPSH